MVLAAGLGTRLRPLSDVRAKPAVPIAGVPLIGRIISWLAAAGVTDVVVNLHHRPETIAAVLGDGADLGVQVRYTWEQPVVLGSAGGPRLALPLLGRDPFLLVNGDTLTEVDLAALSAAHRESGALVTLALVPDHDPSKYGGVSLEADGALRGFVPRGRTVDGTRHFVGVQVVHPDAFAHLDPGQPVESFGTVYPHWIAARPGSIRGHVAPAAFWDVGTVRDYWRTARAFERRETSDTWMGAGSRIDASAQVTDSILWDHVEVSAGCVLDRCIVADGVRLAPGTTGTQSVFHESGDGRLIVTPFEAS
jgi:NDP-sugar pyrophosphorylase family protein